MVRTGTYPRWEAPRLVCPAPAVVGRGGEHGLALPLCRFLLSPTLHPELRSLIFPGLEAGGGREEKMQGAGELLLDL